MAATPKPMNQIKQILRLHIQGVPIKRIARDLGISRNTVRRYLALQQSSGEDLLELSDLEFHQRLHPAATQTQQEARYEYVKDRYEYYAKELLRTGVTRLDLWITYRNDQPHGYSYSQFCYILQRLDMSTKVTMAHLPHDPGDQAYIDYAGKSLHYTDLATGEIVPAAVLVVTLGHSQFTFVRASQDQTTESFIHGLTLALEYYDGVPRTLVPDNLKAAVVRSDRYEPTLNQVFSDFAEHYGTTVLPARRRKPKDKALVENAVQQVYRNIYAPLRDHRFFSLDQLNAAITVQLGRWMDRVMNQRGVSRAELFHTIERASLQPLVATRFQIRKYRDLKVANNAHIELREDRHYYSVPYTWIGRVVQVRYTHDHVHIFGNHQLLAVHARDRRANRYTTIAEHLPSNHQHWLKRSPHFYVQWGLRLGSDVAMFVEKVFENVRHPEHAYRRCDGLIALQRKSDPDTFVSAIQLALRLHTYSLGFVRNAITSGMARGVATVNPPSQELPAHTNVRGNSYYR
ncbi:MAG: transposase [Bacteroidetes bacterium HLUCCA01]|nr:MAG: transposase [Bacteroidetes bacterium HLUCCA01]